MTDPIIITFSSGVLAIPFGVAAVGTVVAIVFSFRREWVYASVSMLVALVAGLVFGPSMLNDQVVITNDRIEQSTGFAWSPTVKGFEFDEVSYVHITVKPTGPKQRLNEVWEVHYHNGSTHDIDLGDLWEGNSNKIVHLLTERGVEFQ